MSALRPLIYSCMVGHEFVRNMPNDIILIRNAYDPTNAAKSRCKVECNPVCQQINKNLMALSLIHITGISKIMF